MPAAIRIPDSTYQTIRELAGDGSMQAVVVQAVEAFRRQRIIDQANEGFAALRRDPVAWSQEEAERDEWVVTLGDGLEGD
jgi:hypothetical protein